MTHIATSKSVTPRASRDKEKSNGDGGSNTEGIEKGKEQTAAAAAEGGGGGGRRSQHFRAMRHPR